MEFLFSFIMHALFIALAFCAAGLVIAAAFCFSMMLHAIYKCVTDGAWR